MKFNEQSKCTDKNKKEGTPIVLEFDNCIDNDFGDIDFSDIDFDDIEIVEAITRSDEEEEALKLEEAREKKRREEEKREEEEKKRLEKIREEEKREILAKEKLERSKKISILKGCIRNLKLLKNRYKLSIQNNKVMKCTYETYAKFLSEIFDCFKEFEEYVLQDENEDIKEYYKELNKLLHPYYCGEIGKKLIMKQEDLLRNDNDNNKQVYECTLEELYMQLNLYTYLEKRFSRTLLKDRFIMQIPDPFNYQTSIYCMMEYESNYDAISAGKHLQYLTKINDFCGHDNKVIFKIKDFDGFVIDEDYITTQLNLSIGYIEINNNFFKKEVIKLIRHVSVECCKYIYESIYSSRMKDKHIRGSEKKDINQRRVLREKINKEMANGKSKAAIAKEIGCNRKTIYNLLNSKY